MRIHIQNAIHYGKIIEGDFEMTREFSALNFPNTPREGKVHIKIGDKEKGVWINRADITYLDKDADFDSSTAEVIKIAAETTEEKIARINERFKVMDIMTDGIINGTISSLIISAAPGVGKTYGIEMKLEKAEEFEAIQKYEFVKGQCSAIGLFMKLWDNKDEGNVIVFDDADSIFYDDVALNVLKAALDTTKKRIISWNTASTVLENADIPNRFEFNGTVVFISNLNFDEIVAKGKRLAPHISALLSRCIYLDLGVHTAEEILIRINDVVLNSGMVDDLGLTDENKKELVDWININASKLRSLSLRTVLQVANFIRTSSDGWKRIAEVTLFKPVRFN